MNLISENLFEKALIEPIRQGADELFIVSGYATATMAMRHIEYARATVKKDIAIRLIVGMCPQDGIQMSQHLGFQKLESGEYGNDFKCDYIYDRPPVHSKVYSWFKQGEPFKGLVGSANYTQNAFSTSQREILADKEASECYGYYESLLSQTINCKSSQVPDVINIYDQQIVETIQNSFQPEESNSENDFVGQMKVTLSLLSSRDGNTPGRSGLNWGQRPGRDPNQAYIAIPTTVQRTNFFPDRHQSFMILTDDGKELICVRAQDGGKAIETSLKNSLLGEYFRYRLGLSDGEYVTKEHLLKYGRTDVDFYKIDDETYYMNFSVE